MKMKRLLALALAGVMTFSMAACGGGSEDKKAEGEQKTVNGDVLDAEQHFNTYLFSEPSTLDSVKGNDNYGNGILLNIMEPLNYGAIDTYGRRRWEKCQSWSRSRILGV